MPDSVRGYRELGISESGDGEMLDQGEGHINSVRKFWPGDLYDPEVSTSSPNILPLPCKAYESMKFFLPSLTLLRSHVQAA